MRSYKADGNVQLFVRKADNDRIVARMRFSRPFRAKAFFPVHVTQRYPLYAITSITAKQ